MSRAGGGRFLGRLRRHEVHCPACLHRIDLDAVPIRDVAGAATGETLRWDDRRSKDVAFELLRTGRYLSCPRGHELPPDYLKIPSHVVALVGPSRSMKTHFLAVTTHAAVQHDRYGNLGDGYTCSISTSDATDRLLSSTYWPLIETNQALGRTRPQEDAESWVLSPICLRVDWQYGSADRRNIAASHLLLFDAPGELVGGTAEQQARVAPYLTVADLVVFFVDVVQVKEIRRQLPQAVQVEYAQDEYRTDIVNKAVRLIRTKRGLRPNQRVPVPALVLLSKADLLGGATGELARFLGSDGRSVTTLGEDEGSALARDLSDAYISGLVPKVQEGFSSHRLLLASALGSQPAGDGSIEELRPFGCDEAFRHILRASGAVG